MSALKERVRTESDVKQSAHALFTFLESSTVSRLFLTFICVVAEEKDHLEEELYQRVVHYLESATYPPGSDSRDYTCLVAQNIM